MKPPTSTFFSGACTLSNVWRSTGNHEKINKVASEHRFTPLECKCIFKLPGKCLKGRWGSLYGVLVIILGAVAILRVVFESMWGKLGGAMEEVKAG